MKTGHTGIKRIVYATGYSFKGLRAAWCNEAAFRQESVAALVLIIVAFFLPVSKLEQLAMIGSLAIVLIAELMNSAVEAVVDRISDEHHELSGRAKDIGSAAVFVSLALAAFTWGYILI